jgi:hypothetical protein
LAVARTGFWFSGLYTPWPCKQSDEDEQKPMNMKRMRGRNHRPNNGGGGGGGFRNQQNGIPLNRNHVFDSSGPEMRLRGTAQQLHEKYTQLARDASSSGDRVLGEAYYQHAEHYFRIISAINQAQGQSGQQPAQQPHNGNGYQNNQNDYQPRRQDGGMSDGQQDLTETRQQEPRYQEQAPQQETRQEPRQQEQPRRYEQRPYEPRNKPEFQRNERPERYRPETPVADTRIDISSALEAELAAASAEPPGFGEQPVIATAPAPEARAIPIIPDAPPAAEVAPKVVRTRGRPRLAKNEPKDTAAD